MIQRRQTLYLLLALIAEFACICLPLAQNDIVTVFNLAVVEANGAYHYGVNSVLLCLLIGAVAFSGIAVFAYRRRLVQSKICTVAAMTLLLWYALFTHVAMQQPGGLAGLSYKIGGVMPLLAAILCFLARRAVLADEALVRAADRIR